MAMGGGSFTLQNKVMPGTYINFVSAARAASALGDRGTVTIGLELSWGPDGEVVTVERSDASTDSLKIFGRAWSDPEMLDIRDIFAYAKKLMFYKLNSGGSNATGKYATAKYPGTFGNKLSVSVQSSIDGGSGYFDVRLMKDGSTLDEQTVKTSKDLQDNDFVVWSKTAALTASATAEALTGGTDGTVTNESHSKYLSEIEPYAFNAIGCKSEDTTIKALYIAFTKRMRDTVGSKFSLILSGNDADYEGVIDASQGVSLVPWVLGATGGCELDSSCTNMVYNGEATFTVITKQSELEAAIKNGKFVIHKVGDYYRVLEDLNTLTTFTTAKREEFKSNQTIRVIDQIANDIAAMFNERYIGRVQNDDAGRTSLWVDITKHHAALRDAGVIDDFQDDDITITAGDTKTSVVVEDWITITERMNKLYMTVTVG